MIKGVRMTSRCLTPSGAVSRRLTAGAVMWLATAMTMPAAAGAQTTTGNIRGYVRGPNNAPVPDAQPRTRSRCDASASHHRRGP